MVENEREEKKHEKRSPGEGEDPEALMQYFSIYLFFSIMHARRGKHIID
jgi:hypothetical protein